MSSSTVDIQHGTFLDLQGPWQKLLADCAEPTFFDTMIWHKTWWKEFGSDADLKLLILRSWTNEPCLIAPLMMKNSEITFIGGTDLVDYHDFLTQEPQKYEYIDAVVDRLTRMESVNKISLSSIPDNSPTIKHFRESAELHGWVISVEQEDVAPRMQLPSSYEDYMLGLRKKDRHELRRKLRRLEGAGEFLQIELRSPSEVSIAMDDFFRLHRMSTSEKNEFMTVEREQFFAKIAVELAREDMTRLTFLEFNGDRVATSLSYVCGDVRYLYNSGYNPNMYRLSVGLLNHLMSIKSSIETGIRVFDFMRGNESYKYHLGGIDRKVFAITASR